VSDGVPQTRFTRLVLPADTNHLGTLYGGSLLAWMDSAAGIAGVRRAGTRTVVTAAVDELTFRVAIREGELVELIAEVQSVGRTSMRVGVEAHREDPVTHVRELCTVGVFTMVALDDEGRPTPIRDL
jgi:acyl-CoA hydrolase